MKTWEIYRHTYGDVCGDSWYGKESRNYTLGYVTDTEDNVKALVEKLNEKNCSYYAKNEPEDDWDESYDDEDYIAYTELKAFTCDELEQKLFNRR